MTDITTIALSKLVESEENVRKSNRKSGIAELAASIKAHTLLQSLVVRATDNGKFAVIAGGRRLRALRLLAKIGDIEKNTLIPCRVIGGDENDTELSLAENTVRLDMSLADEIEAMAARIDAGEGPEAIAARFGVTAQHVARRIKLARVSPRLIAALRKDEIDADQLAALALVDDHAAQEKAFFDAPDWARTPQRIKAALLQTHVPETDKLARFVGVDAYLAEGGGVTRDLFADEDGTPALWLTDRDLLVRLAEAKLQPIADTVRGEGWAWVEVAIDEIGWQRFPTRVREEHRTLSKREQTKLEKLYAKLDETEDAAAIAKIEAQIDALAATAWVSEEVKLAGAVITLNHNGEPRIERGLVKAEDQKALKAQRRAAAKSQADNDADGEGAGGPPTSPASRSSIPAKLVDELMAHKTLALRTEVAAKPDLALRLVVLALTSNLQQDFGTFSLVRVEVDEADMSRFITRTESTAPQMLAHLTDAWRERLPSGVDALWRFIAEADQQTLLDLLAVLVAPAIELRSGRAEGVADAICEAAGLDMSKFWKATAASYFEHVRRDVVIDALKDEKPALDRRQLEKASKAELVTRAKRVFKSSTWLPEPLRVGHPATHAAAAAIAAE